MVLPVEMPNPETVLHRPVIHQVDSTSITWGKRARDASRDLVAGFKQTHIWHLLALQEVRQRYRRSMLGPLWITISTGVLIGAMGPLYGSLFGQDLAEYFPYLGVSFVLWILISSLINEACTVFIGAEGVIKQVRMPLSIHVYRHVWKNLIVFMHHLVIVLVIVLFFQPPFSWFVVVHPIAGLLLIALNGVWVALLLGVVCARYRDIPLIVQNVVQVLFFLTPVLWRPKNLGPLQQWAANVNPLHHFLEIVRSPLLGAAPTLLNYTVAFAVTIAGFALAFAFFARFRSRIPYWV